MSDLNDLDEMNQGENPRVLFNDRSNDGFTIEY